MKVLFSAAIGLSAFLLFSVQPLIAKALLPYLGGGAAVWTGCMLVFQALLLGGYLYVHGFLRRLPFQRQVAVHMTLALASMLALPLAVNLGGDAPDAHSPIRWLTQQLITTIALPFLVLSASAPLLQSWFAQWNDRRAGDPYVLYAASNLGSVFALLLYPSIIESQLDLAAQALAWSASYVAFVASAAACAAAVWRVRRENPASVPTAEGPATSDGPTLFEKARWVYLAFVPSTMMLSVTTYVTTDLAPVPLLWIVPLALYLLTFTIAFAGWLGPRALRFCAVAVGIATLVVTAVMLLTDSPLWVPVHLVAFFLGALLCHGELVRRRPAVAYLTGFYLWLAVGGAAGGLFNTLVAPAIFVSLTEYRLGLALLLFVPAMAAGGGWRASKADVAAIAIFVFAVWATRQVWQGAQAAAVLIPIALIAVAARRQPLRRAVMLAMALIAFTVWPSDSNELLFEGRNFYGTLRVTQQDGFRALYHGTTLHGAQTTDPRTACDPLTYYARTSPIGQLFDSFARHRMKRHPGVVGLGAAALAAYARPNQRWTFYEINPLAAEIAENPAYFTYLRRCARAYEIRLGDARLSLERQPDAAHDVLIVDAFSSDAIPVHLLTREAVRVYMRTLAPDGVLAIHITNRFLDLAPVVGALAADAGLVAVARLDTRVDVTEYDRRAAPADWVVLARGANELGELVHDRRWRRIDAASPSVWRDGFSNVFTAVRVRGLGF